MFKGVVIFVGGMVVGTAYGLSMGVRLTKSIENITEAVAAKAAEDLLSKEAETIII